MRSAEEWQGDYLKQTLAGLGHCIAIPVDLIRAIQRDALEAAAKVCDHTVRYAALKIRQAHSHKRGDLADQWVAVSDASTDEAKNIRALTPKDNP